MFFLIRLLILGYLLFLIWSLYAGLHHRIVTLFWWMWP